MTGKDLINKDCNIKDFLDLNFLDTFFDPIFWMRNCFSPRQMLVKIRFYCNFCQAQFKYAIQCKFN